MENEIQSWLEGPRDYTQGRNLFEKYSTKKPLINLFRRKNKPEVLTYNLQKLCKSLFAFSLNPLAEKIVVEPPEIKDISFSDHKLKIVTDKINYDELPVRLQKLYDQNKALYKHMRSYHEQIKLAKTDEDRKTLRQIVADYDDVITAIWKEIDAWVPGQDNMDSANPDPQIEIAAAKRYLSANVKYLSLRQGVKQQQLLFLIQEKIEILKINKVKISKTVIDELLKIGINI